MGSDLSSEDNEDILFVPSPQRLIRKYPPVPCPRQLVVVSIEDINKFVEEFNKGMQCATPSCSGKRIAYRVRLKGVGGTCSITYVCEGCGFHPVTFEGCSVMDGTNISNIGASILVAFIISGCLYATYYKVMKLALGIDVYRYNTYKKMLERLLPITKDMLDGMCTEAKNDMKKNKAELGSWSKAVTCADGVWQTRGFHSKNGTFSVPNYMNGALLYYMHLCQKGSDDVINEDLYGGTSKSMEGFAARRIMTLAKEEGMNIAVQWQDSDASSAKHIKECFPDCRIMICGGHAGKNHLKVLESYLKIKRPTKQMINKHKSRFPSISSATCCCENRNHFSGCGCLTNGFIKQARNNFFFYFKGLAVS